jgi:endo-1,3(4)-beta-glucanase
MYVVHIYLYLYNNMIQLKHIIPIFFLIASKTSTIYSSIFHSSNVSHPVQRDALRWSRVDKTTLLTEPFPTNAWWEPFAIGNDMDTNVYGGWYPITTYPYQFQFADHKLSACVLNTSTNNNNVFQTTCQSTWTVLPQEESSLYINTFTDTSLNCTIESSYIGYNIYLTQGMPFIHINIHFNTHHVFNMTVWPPIQTFVLEHTIPNAYWMVLSNGNQWLCFVPSGATLWQTSYNQISFIKGTFLRLMYVESTLHSILLKSYHYSYSNLFIQPSFQTKSNGLTQYIFQPLEWENGNFSFYALPYHVQQLHLSLHSTNCTFYPTSLISSHGNIFFVTCNQPFTFSLQLPTLAYNNPYHFSDIPSIYLDTVRLSFMNDICTTLYMYVSSDCSTGVYWIGKSIHRITLSIQLSDQLGEIAIRNALVLKLFNILYSLFTSGGFVYDSTWDGVLCSHDISSVDNNYGCGWYNDHHFQYGYIIMAGAIVSKYNSTCMTTLRPYINEFVKDIQTRHFNWYLGHSWATGLFSSERNQESSSEAIQANWAIYIWGQVTSQTDIKNKGQAMVLLETYTTNTYYPSLHSLYPLPYSKHTVTGVLFDTWVWYSTFFGSNPEYIHGIHFLPYGTHHLLEFWPKMYTQEWIELQSTQTGDWKPITYGIWSQINRTSAWDACISAQDSSFDLFSPRSIVLWFIAAMGV